MLTPIDIYKWIVNNGVIFYKLAGIFQDHALTMK